MAREYTYFQASLVEKHWWVIITAINRAGIPLIVTTNPYPRVLADVANQGRHEMMKWMTSKTCRWFFGTTLRHGQNVKRDSVIKVRLKDAVLVKLIDGTLVENKRPLNFTSADAKRARQSPKPFPHSVRLPWH